MRLIELHDQHLVGIHNEKVNTTLSFQSSEKTQTVRLLNVKKLIITDFLQGNIVLGFEASRIIESDQHAILSMFHALARENYFDQNADIFFSNVEKTDYYVYLDCSYGATLAAICGYVDSSGVST